MFSEWIFKITDWIGEIKYRLPSLFTDEEKSILILVFVMIVMLPAVLCILRRKPLVRGMALAVFAFYILGNLSFTILGRDVIYAQKLPTFGNYRQAFYLDYSLFDTLRMLPQGVSSTMEHVHINNYTAAKEVFLNILLYIPMGYLLPFVIKPMRYSVAACTAVGFLCSCATEYAQLHWSIGYFQVDDIINNTLGCMIGAILGCLLARLWRTS